MKWLAGFRKTECVALISQAAAAVIKIRNVQSKYVFKFGHLKLLYVGKVRNSTAMTYRKQH